MNKQCVNCPGATDHSTAECPVMCEQMKMDAERAAFEAWWNDDSRLTMRTFTSKHWAEAVWQARARLPVGVPDLQITGHLDECEAPLWEFINAEARKLGSLTGSIDTYNFCRPDGAQPNGCLAVLWNGQAIHAVGLTVRDLLNRTQCVRLLAAAPSAPTAEPAPLNPSHRALIRLAMNLLNLRNHVPGSDVDLCVKALADLLEGKHSPAPEPSEAWREVAEIAQAEAPAVAMPPEISRDLLGKIVDEVFDGAIEDASVIEDVYRVIAREYRTAPAVVNLQVTTAELTSVRCQCCQAEHAADSYDSGFIAGSGMCQVCDAAMPPKDLPVAGIEEVEVVAYQSGKSGMCYGEPYGLEVAKPLMTVEQHRRILDALINTPHTDEWFSAVRLEAAHQIQRWGTDHDAGKQPADWFWLLGYLSQKAMAAQMAGDEQKAKHHTISSGAMLLNWFRAMVGDTNAMRPGIAQDQQEVQP